jgi:hypothetical protein
MSISSRHSVDPKVTGDPLDKSAFFRYFRPAGDVILSGDVAHSRREFRLGEAYLRLTSIRINRDNHGENRSIMRETGAQLWINHDIEQNSCIPHLPQFVE